MDILREIFFEIQPEEFFNFIENMRISTTNSQLQPSSLKMVLLFVKITLQCPDDMYFKKYEPLGSPVEPIWHSIGLKISYFPLFRSRSHPVQRSQIGHYRNISHHNQSPHSLLKLTIHVQNMCGLSPSYINQQLSPFQGMYHLL